MVATISKIIEFDVVIPFGGNLEFLIETVESVITQDYPFWHLCILDDDTKIKDLYIYIAQINNPKISIIRYKSKLGITKVFDESISVFKNQWGVILGADDILDRHYLHEMSLAIKQFPESTLIHPTVKVINSRGQKVQPFVDIFKKILKGKVKIGVFPKARLSKSLAIGNWMYLGACVFSTKFLKENRFNPDFQIAMDYELILRMVTINAPIVYWPKAVFFFRRHSESYSNSAKNLDLRLKEELTIMEAYSKQLKERGKYFAAAFARAGLSMRVYYIVAKLRHKLRK